MGWADGDEETTPNFDASSEGSDGRRKKVFILAGTNSLFGGVLLEDNVQGRDNWEGVVISVLSVALEVSRSLLARIVIIERMHSLIKLLHIEIPLILDGDGIDFAAAGLWDGCSFVVEGEADSERAGQFNGRDKPVALVVGDRVEEWGNLLAVLEELEYAGTNTSGLYSWQDFDDVVVEGALGDWNMSIHVG